MKNERYPKISFIIPTFNSGERLDKCLKSVRNQEYPKDRIEIIISDGGSVDNTLQVAEKYSCKSHDNKRKLPEPGKALGIKNATGDLLCFIDDDNFLPSDKWLKKMVYPFLQDSSIDMAEPYEFTYSRNLNTLERYWALSGFNDPVMYYIGCYDRLNLVSGRWTDLKLKTENKGNYIKVCLSFEKMPTIGANGFMVKSKVVKSIDYENLLDIDRVAEIVRKGNNILAKVKVDIVHTFCKSLRFYSGKAKRKANNFIGNIGYSGRNVKEKTERIYQYPHFKNGIIKFILSTITLLPLIFYSFKGYLRKKDSAWFLHIPVCWITLIVYGGKTIRKLIK